MDHRIRNAIVLKNIGIVHALVRNIARGPDAEDMIQAGTIGLMSAVERFDPNRGAFIVFAKWHILNEIQRCACQRRGLAPRSRPRDPSDELAAEIVHQTGGVSTGDYAASDARRMLERALAGCTPEEVAAMLAYADGASATEIAAAFGGSISRSEAILTVRAALARAHTALEDA